MKSLKVLAALAIAAATFSACGNSTPKANLKTDVDSLSYAIGLAQSQYVRQAIQQGQVIDTTYMDEFVKGINEGANAGDDKKRAAYIMGLQIGQQIATQLVKGVNHEVYGNDSTKTISLKNLLAGFVTGATGKKGLMTPEMANQVAQTKMEIIKSKTMMKEYGANKVCPPACSTRSSRKDTALSPQTPLPLRSTTKAAPSTARSSKAHIPTAKALSPSSPSSLSPVGHRL